MLAAFAFGGVTLAAFGWWESHTDQPMLDMAFFTDARISAAALSTTLVFFGLFGTIFFLTQYLQWWCCRLPSGAEARRRRLNRDVQRYQGNRRALRKSSQLAATRCSAWNSEKAANARGP